MNYIFKRFCPKIEELNELCRLEHEGQCPRLEPSVVLRPDAGFPDSVRSLAESCLRKIAASSSGFTKSSFFGVCFGG